MMMGAKSRDAPRRARPKYALDLAMIANGMNIFWNLIVWEMIFLTKCRFYAGQTDKI